MLYIKASMKFLGRSVHFDMWATLRVIWNTKNKPDRGKLIYFHLKSYISTTSKLFGYMRVHVNGGTLLSCVCCIHNKVVAQSVIISFKSYFFNYCVFVSFSKIKWSLWTNKHTCQDFQKYRTLIPSFRWKKVGLELYPSLMG